ncbi:hypothetical protein [Laspinema olomoucense]|uniref:hypothetical protein n=1 Tax=Laspinema olomoucense TaxID=3231600 RepID=UPI0021BAB581|nr:MULTISPECIES: hypothetical protein [unclassified Laspinema]MCT7972992.1 hypothetical protein [Laspinema sp. D3d]MCT7987036.1 hypothetical protein [Laspinema sp. D3a]
MNPQPNPASDRIFAPNVYLCAYSLRDESIQGENHPLWHDCDVILNQFTPEKLTPHLDFSQTENSPYRQSLLPNASAISFTLTDSPDIAGFAQPLQIDNSYAVIFHIGYNDEKGSTPEVAVNHLKIFKPQTPLLLPTHPKFLGQTLILTAYLTPKLKQQYRQSLEELVNSCYQSLINPDLPPISRQGELFGSPIFEYGKISHPDESPHVLIWLLHDKQTDHLFKNCFYFIFDLLFYRSKIIRLFHDSRSASRKLNIYYREVEQFLPTLQSKLNAASPDAKDDAYLDDLKTLLKNLSRNSIQYSPLLVNMKYFATKMETNLYNYQDRIDDICARLKIHKEELSFLKHFGEETVPYFQRQIKADLGRFEHGTELINQAIASIRGIVEIDQAKRDRLRLEQEKQRDLEQVKRDRNLETQIYIIGTGLAGAGITASLSGYLTAESEKWKMTIQWRPDFNLPLHPFTQVLGISMMAGLIFALLAWLIRGIQSLCRKR